MALFKKKHIPLILAGRKVQTRRVHTHEWKIGRCYMIRDHWFDKGKGTILITRKFKQRLSEISLEDVKKEGYDTLEEFQQVWIEIHGAWQPNRIVTAYEFKLVPKIGKPSSAITSQQS
jgi:hypothetical protein